MSQEIEQAYRVNETLLPQLGTVPAKHIDQVYFTPHPASGAYPEVAHGEWRVRTTATSDGVKHQATIKFGDKQSGSRTEIETALNPGDFGTTDADVAEYGFGRIAKTRYNFGDGLTLDQFDDPTSLAWLAEKEFVSSEEAAAWQPPKWCSPAGNIPGNRALARRLPAEVELFHTRRQLDIRDIQEKQRQYGHIVVTVSGMSGSGKSTFAREIAERFNATYIEADHYHIGTSRLAAEQEEINHDLPEAYDYHQVAQDIASLMRGEEILAPHYDFQTGERIDGKGNLIKPSLNNIIVVEGLYTKQIATYLGEAETPPFTAHNVLVDTPLYVCVLRRMVREAVQEQNSVTATRQTSMNAEETLRYLHQTAIPTYQKYAHHPELFDSIVS